MSLPNVAHLYVRLNILLGRFPYHSKGILDKTHLRFYTYVTAKQMLKKTGWLVKEHDITTLPWGIVFPFLKNTLFGRFLSFHFMTAKLLKGLFAYQYIFYCRNPNEAALL